MTLSWLEKMLSELPETPKTRRNLLEIAGITTNENVISNLLAFYLDPQEEHGFSSLFLDGLLALLVRKWEEAIVAGEQEPKKPIPAVPPDLELFQTDVTVEREVSTESGRRIDLVLQELVLPESARQEAAGSADDNSDPAWAILIESKIYAPLYNDLDDYWQSVVADQKYGIVLSAYAVDIPAEFRSRYINITLHELITELRPALADCFLTADDRHLLFLKDFLASIHSLYRSNYNEMEDTLNLFRRYHTQISELQEKDKALSRYVLEAVTRAMASFGFVPQSNKIAWQKSFRFDGNTDHKANPELLQHFWFWFDLEALKKESSLYVPFGIRGKKYTVHGPAVKDKLRDQGLFTEVVVEGDYNKNSYHIYGIKLELSPVDGETLAERLRTQLEERFFQHPNQFVTEAVSALAEAMQEEGTEI